MNIEPRGPELIPEPKRELPKELTEVPVPDAPKIRLNAGDYWNIGKGFLTQKALESLGMEPKTSTTIMLIVLVVTLLVGLASLIF